MGEDDMKIEIPGFGPVDIQELKDDVEAAKENGLTEKWAFTPETVQGLIDKVEELQRDIDIIEMEELIQMDMIQMDIEI